VVVMFKGICPRILAVIVIWLLVITAGLPAAQAAPAMVLVDGGMFYMGDESRNARSNEHPVHQVKVNSFYMSQYEVTFDEYDRYRQDKGRSTPNDDHGRGYGRQPVEDVSWQDAVEYCNWCSQQEGLTPAYSIWGNNITCDFGVNGYRLPTEAEWEYAARGGIRSQGYKYSGSDDLGTVAWYKENSGGRIQPVGQKQPNELELYDMSGNVWEWCWDWYDKSYYTSSDADNPAGLRSGLFHVIRGGDRGAYSGNLRLSVRLDYTISSVITTIGFRLVRTAL